MKKFSALLRGIKTRFDQKIKTHIYGYNHVVSISYILMTFNAGHNAVKFIFLRCFMPLFYGIIEIS